MRRKCCRETLPAAVYFLYSWLCGDDESIASFGEHEWAQCLGTTGGCPAMRPLHCTMCGGLRPEDAADAP